MFFKRKCNLVGGLFCNYPIGTRLGVGTDSCFWVGNFECVRDEIAELTEAQLFVNGKAVDGCRREVRIPICKITFVAE